MFTVYHSNKLETLKILLVHLIQSDPYKNPFESERILVQSPGMSQWLKMALADELGIAANIEFPLPATFIWDIFTELLDDVPAHSAFNKESMVWKLVQLLPKLKERTEFSPVKQYLDRDSSELNLYQLAEKISDIFDSYLVYRPEWIDAWERGENIGENKDIHPWQPVLWRELYRYTLELGQSHYHRANLYQTLIEQLQSQDLSQSSLPKRLFIFGITALPPRYIDALRALGEHIDVHLMFTNPCQYYWGDLRDRKTLAWIAQQQRLRWIKNCDSVTRGEPVSILKGGIEDNEEDSLHLKSAVGNDLLASMGKLGRDNLLLLSQTESEEHELFIDIDRVNLLTNIQADLLNLEEHQSDDILLSSHHKPAMDVDDRSLSFHACHSPMREIEVLHDHLLSLFDEDPDLTPKDIIVMVADINDYSPAIQAVFGNAPGERFIPFSISDRTADQESPVLNAFLHILNLPRSRCLASEFLELLEIPAVSRRFDISDEEFIQAKRWIEESGIRWGLNQHTAKEFDLPETYQNTWEFGIARMLTGYAMGDEVDWIEVKGECIAPYSEVQGLKAELAGKLAFYIETIRRYRDRLNIAHSIDVWRDIMDNLLNDFFAVDLEEEVAFYSIRELFGQLKEQISESHYAQPMTFDLLVYYLTQKLSGTRVSQRFLAGQVNFCTLMPMRSIPFKVVCLLGMNDGVYPRSIPAEGFDLMALSPRPGDRSRRDDDRYLFLEALISAQSSLYISYVGQSVRDNTPLSPSVLVTELQEYCYQNYCLHGDEDLDVDASGQRLLHHLTFHHSMVPYGHDAFSGEKPSYAAEWLTSAKRKTYNESEPEQDLVDYWLDKTFPFDLELTDFQRFWSLPVRYFFNVRLGVYFDEPVSEQKDEEPFILNHLENYYLMDALIPLMLQTETEAGKGFEHLRKKLSAQGKLPVGAFGDLDFHQQVVRVTPLVEGIREVCGGKLPDQEIELEFKVPDTDRGIHLNGWISECYQSGLVRYRPGRLRAQDYLTCWIEHLAYAAMGNVCVTHMIALSPKQEREHQIYEGIRDSEWAKAELASLVSYFLDGMNKPLAYFPRTALAGIESLFRKGQWTDDEDGVFDKMARTFCGDDYFDGEGQNVYISRIWPEWNDELARRSRHITARVLEIPRKYARAFGSEKGEE
ncbi:exodeoxyribonuclease V subunit gamma [Vibrio salinus]|uniref:exodeoxyribonuclease V subunit gamma n=1 Tax=Vibrio salinus TaxID=2899784 RepID=UPI001E2B1DBC|nr:exodeoxyribonuclease V subunit gamma [Vibrio salinus]MCE0494334.1 exodeoxyribonuclease V subunit gamma [Vibrio salinus]